MDNKEMPPAAEPVMAGATSPSSFVLSPVQEMINGRAAMMGFVSAVVAEVATGHSVWSQVAGKYVDQELVEPALGLSDVGFGAIVVLTTLATFAPKVMDMSEAEMKTKSFGLLTPEKELLNGR